MVHLRELRPGSCLPSTAVSLMLVVCTATSAVAQGQPVAEAPAAPPGAHADGAAVQDATPGAEPAPEIAPVPTAKVQSEYRSVVAGAIAEFDAARFAESRALFLRAHELWPSARTWRTLGMTAFELRMYPRALVELQAALDDTRRPLLGEPRAQVAALIEQTRAFVGRYRVQGAPAGAELMIDGVPVVLDGGSALVLAVGQHELRVRAAGHEDQRRTLQVQGREDEELALALAPMAVPAALAPVAPVNAALVAPAPPALAARDVPTAGPDLRRKFAYAAIGVAAAGVVIGAVWGGLALQRKGVVANHCDYKRCLNPYVDEMNEMKRYANVSTAGFAVAGAFAVLAVSLWFAGQAGREQRRNARVESHVGLGSAGIVGTF